jgi:hypothetical protein
MCLTTLPAHHPFDCPHRQKVAVVTIEFLTPFEQTTKMNVKSLHQNQRLKIKNLILIVNLRVHTYQRELAVH